MDLHEAYKNAYNKNSLNINTQCNELVSVLVDTEAHVKNIFYISICFFLISWNLYSFLMVVFLGMLYFSITQKNFIKQYYMRKKLEEFRQSSQYASFNAVKKI